jgi:hypothetical protein
MIATTNCSAPPYTRLGIRARSSARLDHRTSNPRVGSSNLSERANEINWLLGAEPYHFCAWETVGKLLQAAPRPLWLSTKKISRAADEGRPASTYAAPYSKRSEAVMAIEAALLPLMPPTVLPLMMPQAII